MLGYRFWRGGFLCLILMALSCLSARAAIRTVSISAPSPNTTVQENIAVSAFVDSDFELQSVTASIGSHLVPLAFSGGSWKGTVSLIGVPNGDQTLTVTATDVVGATGTAQETVNNQTPPAVTDIQILMPLFGRTFDDSIYFAVRITTRSGHPVQSVTASLKGQSASLQFYGELSQAWEGVLNVSGIPEGAVDVVITVKTMQGETQDKSVTLYHNNPSHIAASPAIKNDVSQDAFSTVPHCLDSTHDTAPCMTLYTSVQSPNYPSGQYPSVGLVKLDYMGYSNGIGDIGFIEDYVLIEPPTLTRMQRFNGLILDVTPSQITYTTYGRILHRDRTTGKDTLISPLVNSYPVPRGTFQKPRNVNDNYLVYDTSSGLALQNKLNGTNTFLKDQGTEPAVNSTGTVVYIKEHQVVRFRNGTTTLIAHDPTTTYRRPLVDETGTIIYQKTKADSAPAVEVVTEDNQGLHYESFLSSQERFYDVNNGWVGFQRPAGVGLRSPMGELFVFPGGIFNAVGPNGEFTYSNSVDFTGRAYFNDYTGNHQFLLGTGFNYPSNTFSEDGLNAWSFWENRTLYVVYSNTLFTFDYDSQLPPVTPGDLNRDGQINAQDVNRALQLFLGSNAPTSQDLAAGDVRPKPGTNGRPYGDGVIGSDDLNWLLRRFVGLENAP